MDRARGVLLTVAVLSAGTAGLAGTGAFAGPASPDPSFATEGAARPGFGPITAITRDSAGRYIVAGGGRVLRLTTNGTPDATFNGGNPLLISGFQVGAGDALKVLSSGKILVAGGRVRTGAFYDMAVARLNSGGTLDTSFAAASAQPGVAFTNVPGPSGTPTTLAAAVDVDGEGDILAVGTSTAGDGSHPAAVAYTSAGVLDTGFTGGGIRRDARVGSGRAVLGTDLGFVIAGQASGVGYTEALSDQGTASGGVTLSTPNSAITTLAEGVGSGKWFGGSASSPHRLIVGRLASNNLNIADPDFNGGAPVSVTVPNASGTAVDAVADLAVGAGNFVTTAGAATIGGVNRAVVARFAPTGQLVPEFAASGNPAGVKLQGFPGSTTQRLYGVVVHDDKAVVAGEANGAATSGIVGRLGTPNVAPQIGALTTEPAAPVAGELVTLSAAVTDPDEDDVVSYTWEFPDGTTSTDKNPQKAFPDAGTITVKITATDQSGAATTQERQFTVAVPTFGGVTTSVAPVPGTVLSLAPTVLRASGTVDPASAAPLRYEWDFGERPEARGNVKAIAADPSSVPFAADVIVDTADVTHGFPPGVANDQGRLKVSDGTAPTTYVARVRGVDRHGRRSQPAAVLVRVKPNRAPRAAFAVFPKTLEFKGVNRLVSISGDPDGELDSIVDERFRLGSFGVVGGGPQAGDGPCAPKGRDDIALEAVKQGLKPTGALAGATGVDADPLGTVCRSNTPGLHVPFDLLKLTTGYDEFDGPFEGLRYDGLVAAEEALKKTKSFRPVAVGGRPGARGAAVKKPATKGSVLAIPYGQRPKLAPDIAVARTVSFNKAMLYNRGMAQLIKARSVLMCGNCPRPDRLPITLTVKDRSGATDELTQTIPVRVRARPNARLSYVQPVPGTGGSKSTTEPKEEADAVEAALPIIVDATPGGGDGSLVRFSNSKTSVDARGSAKVHLLEVGTPWQDPGTCSEPPRDTLNAAVKSPIPDFSIYEQGITQQLGAEITAINRADASGLNIDEGVAPAASIGATAGTRSARAAQRTTKRTPLGQVGASTGIGAAAGFDGKPANCADVIVAPGETRQVVPSRFGVTNTIITMVTKDPTKLNFTFPPEAAGKEYSVLYTVVDDSGASSKVRIDGFKPVLASGVCQDVTGSVGTGANRISFSGRCMTFGNDRTLFWTAGPLSWNGLTLKAGCDGCVMVVDNRGAKGRVYASKSTPRLTKEPVAGATAGANDDIVLLPEGKKVDDSTKWPAAGFDLAEVEFLVEDDRIARRKLNPAQAGDVANLGKPVSISAPLPVIVPVAPGAEYKQFPVASKVALVTLAPGGKSRIEFDTKLPDILSAPEGETTSHVVVEKVLTAEADVLETFDDPTAVGSRAKKQQRARAAQGGQKKPEDDKGFKKECDTEKSITGKQKSQSLCFQGEIAGIKLGYNTGNTSLPVLAKYDPKTGEFSALISGDATKFIPNLPLPEAVAKALQFEATLVLKDGDFKSLEGELALPGGLGIPLAGTPGIFDVRGFSFKVVKDPNLGVGAGVLFSAAAGLVKGDAKLFMAFDPFQFRVDANAKVVKLVPINAYVDYIEGERLAFGGGAKGKFGPAKYKVQVDGVIRGSKYNIEGLGEACVASIACLTVKGLVSSRGIAACGELGVGPLTVSAGAGYIWGGDVDVFFKGCDLSGYRVNISRSNGSLAGALQVGQSKTFEVPAGLRTIALDVRGAVPEASPQVRITGPGGARVIQTADQLTGYQFTPDGALVAEDPESGRSSVLIANPAAGTWTVEVLAGVPVAAVNLGFGITPVVPGVVVGRVGRASAKTTRAQLKAGAIHGLPASPDSRPVTLTPKQVRAIAAADPPKTPATAKLLTPLNENRIRPSALADAQLARVRQLQFRAKVPNGTEIVFADARTDDQGCVDPVTRRNTCTLQALASYLVRDVKKQPYELVEVSGSFPFYPSTDPKSKRAVRAYIVGDDGLDRGSIPVATYEAPAVVKKAPPKILDIERLTPVTAIAVLDGELLFPRGTMRELDVVSKTSTGQVTALSVSGRDTVRVKRVGSTWKVVRRGSLAGTKPAIVLRGVQRFDGVSVALRQHGAKASAPARRKIMQPAVKLLRAGR